MYFTLVRCVCICFEPLMLRVEISHNNCYIVSEAIEYIRIYLQQSQA
jgi:hypothetical protein